MPCTLSNSALTAARPASAADTSGNAPNKVKLKLPVGQPHEQDHADVAAPPNHVASVCVRFLMIEEKYPEPLTTSVAPRAGAGAFRIPVRSASSAHSLSIRIESRRARFGQQQRPLAVRGEPHVVQAMRLHARLPARRQVQQLEGGIARQQLLEKACGRRGHVRHAIVELGLQPCGVQRLSVERVRDQVSIRKQLLGNGQRRLLSVRDQSELGVRGQRGTEPL